MAQQEQEAGLGAGPCTWHLSSLLVISTGVVPLSCAELCMQVLATLDVHHCICLGRMQQQQHMQRHIWIRCGDLVLLQPACWFEPCLPGQSAFAARHAVTCMCVWHQQGHPADVDQPLCRTTQQALLVTTCACSQPASWKGHAVGPLPSRPLSLPSKAVAACRTLSELDFLTL